MELTVLAKVKRTRTGFGPSQYNSAVIHLHLIVNLQLVLRPVSDIPYISAHRRRKSRLPRILQKYLSFLYLTIPE